ncbi:tRNA adenosine(34) deaminase TadA [Dubosiella newyorkensis]|uniref:tRNA-specific adenosine deaminase n=1 Tax=Dubosiella newyorkensis TaxID=1862672 RepID=A0A1U7NPN2_9FIRM|nr:tRNA adenosine(34) deaminase TadA [Dubosiella newyorkensis]OLU47592.1 tRNA-specific adenosine deaminase [Dubosiella newyorkensis]
MNEIDWMKKAILQAKVAMKKNEVPIGCVIVRDGKIIARAHNLRESQQIATKHAELIAIERACKKLKTWRLEDCDLYVTLEPCPMCAGAIILSRIRSVTFGAYDPKGGCAGSCTDLFHVKGFNHYPEVHGGILEEECAQLLKDFFRQKRKEKKKNRL